MDEPREAAPTWEQAPTSRRRVRLLLFVAVVAAGAVAALVRGGGAAPPDPVEGSPLTVERSAPEPAGGIGGEQPGGAAPGAAPPGAAGPRDGKARLVLPPMPVAPRAHALGVWTGEEALVWGGFTPLGALDPAAWVEGQTAREQLDAVVADGRERGVRGSGARFDPAAGTWAAMADSPIAGRIDAASVWAGDRWFVWSGWVTGTALGLGGASYDPAEDAWTSLPPAPIAPRADAIAAWTGAEVLVVGGADREFVRWDGAAFDPAADRWRMLPPIPTDVPPAFGSRPAGAWDGEELIVFGGGRVVAYDPAADRWRTLPAPPRTDAPFPDALALRPAGAGGDAPSGGGDAAPVLFGPAYPRLDRVGWGLLHTAGRWSGTALGPLPVDTARPRTLVWTGTDVLVVPGRGRDGADGLGGARWDPATDRWAALPRLATTDRAGATVIWTGAELLAVGGAAPGAVFADGARARP
jgi:hypothetical protein